MANSTFQKVYLDTEGTFGGADGDMASGIRLWPQEKIDIGALEQQLHSGTQVKGSETDLGPKAEATFKNFDFSMTHLLSGATRGALDVITADKTSTYLAFAAGARETPVTAADTIATGTTVSSLVLTTGGVGAYAAGQLIMVGDQVRRVNTYTSGTKTITILIPLSAVPSNGTVVYPVESFTLSGAKASAGLGIEMPQLTSMDVLAKGVICKKFGLGTIVNNEPVTMTAECSAQTWSVGTGLITAAATDEIETHPVYCATASGGLAFYDNSDALWNNCVRSVEFTNAYEEQFIDCLKAVNGRGGHVMTPVDDGLSMIKVSAYMESDTYADIALMLEEETEVCVQIGGTSGNVVGLYMDKAYLKEFIKPTDQDRKYYGDFAFAGTNARLFRA